ncbi:MAG: hypothetical protein ABI114_01210 [Rhodanobacter sp.]
MSSNSTNATNAASTTASTITSASTTASASKPSAQAAFSRGRAKAANWHLTSEGIAADVAAFKKRGGRIEVLGTTPLRSHVAPAASQSAAKSKSAATTAPAAKGVAHG